MGILTSDEMQDKEPLTREELVNELKCSLYFKEMDEAPSTIQDHREGWLDGWNEAVYVVLNILETTE